MKNKSILLVVLLITIGFAAVSTTLFINGVINITSNKEDFDVYFSYAEVDGIERKEIISENKQEIKYKSRGLKSIGEESVLIYDVTNNSTQYDAKVEVKCVPTENEYYRVEENLEKEIIEARTYGSGEVRIELKKTSVEERELEIKCEIEVKAIEKSEANNRPVETRCELESGTEYKFNYSGSSQEFVVPCEGEYKIELWGAQGGGNYSGAGGLGAYTTADIHLKKDFKLYTYIGGTGSLGSIYWSGGGYNGGGHAQIYLATAQNKFGGGGATDIRLINGAWNDFASLKSRIMVAAGGGGISLGNGYTALPNMCAGALSGYSGGAYSAGGGGAQTSGGRNYNSSTYGASQRGSFGYGGNGNSHAGGGGGGYYGGGGGARDQVDGHGGGGSSFISGHLGCDAIAENSTVTNIIHTGQPNHYSGYVFKNTKMIDGAGYEWSDVIGENKGMPTHNGHSIMTGNSGNGFAKITYLGN